MIWKKDKLRPTQPYFVFDTDDFFQEIYLKQGISHFYTYHVNGAKGMRVVPDGCIDLSFEYNGTEMRGYACGTPIEYKIEKRPEFHEVFGVRFMPGVQPELIDVTMRELFDKRVPLEQIIKGDVQWLEKIAAETDFYQRIRVFLEAYTKAEKKRAKPYGKKELVLSVKQMVYESDGKIKVSELEENTGYSVRYINKVFIEEMGFSPKIFCKIIQFQRALEFFNYGAPDKMTDAAVALGYYDQPQFIRDFKKYAGMTPKKYFKLVERRDYKSKVKETSFLGE
ncbi:MAG: helix-turn-helix domain-containing protein [Clostridiales bacterium]|nr:helix-turn-helix domain-containing protein [Clostridiales bacterium]